MLLANFFYPKIENAHSSIKLERAFFVFILIQRIPSEGGCLLQRRQFLLHFDNFVSLNKVTFLNIVEVVNRQTALET